VVGGRRIEALPLILGISKLQLPGHPLASLHAYFREPRFMMSGNGTGPGVSAADASFKVFVSGFISNVQFRSNTLVIFNGPPLYTIRTSRKTTLRKRRPTTNKLISRRHSAKPHRPAEDNA
jgi:hypothetical protein